MATVIRFDENGAAYGVPKRIASGDTVDFELIGEDIQLSDANASKLTLRTNQYQMINTGRVTLGFGADTVEINAKSLNQFTIAVALNSMDSIRSAGGVEVWSGVGGVQVYFLSVGARNPLTVSHSAAGSLSGRCVTLNAGGVSDNATFFLDLSISAIVSTASVSDISAATALISTVTAGDASNAQVQRLTVSRLPDSGEMRLNYDDALTEWFRPDVSGYYLGCLLEDIAEGEFTVDKRTYGTVSEWLITKTDKGTSTALTVEDTFVGPAGVSATLDLTNAQTNLFELGSRDEMPCFLEYEYDGETRFSVPVDLFADLPGQSDIA